MWVPPADVFPFVSDTSHSSLHGVMSQTTRAHRLVQKAFKLGGQRLQVPLLCAIFKAHLEDGKDIADYDVLADIAESSGTMSRNEVRRDHQLSLQRPTYSHAYRPSRSCARTSSRRRSTTCATTPARRA